MVARIAPTISNDSVGEGLPIPTFQLLSVKTPLVLETNSFHFARVRESPVSAVRVLSPAV